MKWFNRADLFKKEYEKRKCPNCDYQFSLAHRNEVRPDFECKNCESRLVTLSTPSIFFYIVKEEAPKPIQEILDYIFSLETISEREEVFYDLMELFGTSDYAESLRIKDEEDNPIKWFSRADLSKKEYDKCNCPKCEHHFGVSNLGRFGSDYTCPKCKSNLVIWENISTNFYILIDEAPDPIKELIEHLDTSKSDRRSALTSLMELFGTSDYAESLKIKEEDQE